MGRQTNIDGGNVESAKTPWQKLKDAAVRYGRRDFTVQGNLMVMGAGGGTAAATRSIIAKAGPWIVAATALFKDELKGLKSDLSGWAKERAKIKLTNKAKAVLAGNESAETAFEAIQWLRGDVTRGNAALAAQLDDIEGKADERKSALLAKVRTGLQVIEQKAPNLFDSGDTASLLQLLDTRASAIIVRSRQEFVAAAEAKRLAVETAARELEARLERKRQEAIARRNEELALRGPNNSRAQKMSNERLREALAGIRAGKTYDGLTEQGILDMLEARGNKVTSTGAVR